MICSECQWTHDHVHRPAEYAALTAEQRAAYDEAVACGATHNDAMEAAHTNGYTR